MSQWKTISARINRRVQKRKFAFPAFALVVLIAALFVPYIIQETLFLYDTPERRGVIGDYIGGVSSAVVGALTIGFLLYFWYSERQENARSMFLETFVQLLQMHSKEHAAMHDADVRKGLHVPALQRFLNWSHKLEWASSNMISVSNQINDVGLAEQYEFIGRWYLSVKRLVLWIEESEVPKNTKWQAIKILRSSLDIDEQQVLYILLFAQGERSSMATTLHTNNFFLFAEVDSCEATKSAKSLIPPSWHHGLKFGD